MKTTKATIATIYFLDTPVEVLMLPDGTFRIAVSQFAEEFQLAKDHATREVKALLGKDFQLAKTASELNPKAVNVMTIEQMETAIVSLAIKGDVKAQAWAKASVGLTFTQLACDAHGIKFEAKERSSWLADRVYGKVARRTLTDALKDYGYTDGFQYARLTILCYNKLGWGEDYQAYKESGAKKFRDSLNDRELRQLERLESFVERRMSQGMHPEQAILDY